MVYEYKYLNDDNYKFLVSDESTYLRHRSAFLEDGILYENDSISFFYNDIDKNRQINILDIGAQCGLYTLLAKFLPNATFYAFEPFKKSYELLNENIKLNNITNVKTYEIALSDKKGEAVFNTCISHNGLHTLGDNPMRFNDIHKTIVNTDTIDNLFYDKDISIDYIKIDTEGFELFILKGGEKTIRKYKPYIQLEYNLTNMEQCNVKSEELMNFINELDYKIYNQLNEELTIVHKSKSPVN